MTKNRNKLVVPRPMQFRKSTARKTFARKIGCDYCLLHFILELAAREAIYIRNEVRGAVPRSHLKKLMEALKTLAEFKDETPRWYHHQVPLLHIDLADGLPYFYETFNIVIHFSAYRDSRIQGFSDAAAKCFKFLDWEDQVRIMESVLAISNGFGLPLDFEEIGVLIDWLEDRGMEPLMVAGLFAPIL